MTTIVCSPHENLPSQTTRKSASNFQLLFICMWIRYLDSSEKTQVTGLDNAGVFYIVRDTGLLPRIRNEGMECHVYALLQCHLEDRNITRAPRCAGPWQDPVKASVPQGNLLGPSLWISFFGVLFHQIPKAIASSISFRKAETNCRLIDKTSTSDKTWQIQSVAEKSHSLMISKRKDRTQENFRFIWMIMRIWSRTKLTYLESQLAERYTLVTTFTLTQTKRLKYNQGCDAFSPPDSRKCCSVIYSKCQNKSVMEYASRFINHNPNP